MKVQHKLTMTARCPVDDSVDFYVVIFRMTCMMRVEDIKNQLMNFRDTKIFQEDLTERLAEGFGCEVETFGIHSGVETTVVCDHADSGKREHGNRGKAGGKTSRKPRPSAHAE